MNTKKGLIVFLTVAILTVSWLIYDYTKKTVNLSVEGYSPDFGLITARDAQKFSFSAGKAVNIVSNFGVSGSSGASSIFAGGTFPLTQKTEKRSILTPKTPTIFDATERSKNKVRLQKLIDKYGNFVKIAAENYGIPELYILTVMAVENPDGNTNAVSAGGFVGLVQINSSSAGDTLQTQKKRRLLKVEDLTFFQKKFGQSVFSNASVVSNAELKDPETSINIGALHLSEIIVHNKFDTVQDIHKIFFSYNRGKNRMSNDGTQNLDIDQLINRYLGGIHNTGAEYVIRALGPHGAADILVNDLGINA